MLQGLPFCVAGAGDLLALFRCISCRYRFGTNIAESQLLGAPGRVFSTGEVRMAVGWHVLMHMLLLRPPELIGCLHVPLNCGWMTHGAACDNRQRCHRTFSSTAKKSTCVQAKRSSVKYSPPSSCRCSIHPHARGHWACWRLFRLQRTCHLPMSSPPWMPSCRYV